jgi:hypothetical protein
MEVGSAATMTQIMNSRLSGSLKVVGNEKGEGRENGYCSKMVSDHGDRCLFTV